MSFQITAFQNDAFQHADVVGGPSASGGPAGVSRVRRGVSRKKQTGKPRTSTGTKRRN